MRIIGNIEHPVLKITVFKMDNKLSVKFETGLYEQTYKFRESEDLNSFESVQSLVDEHFINEVLEFFGQMHRVKTGAVRRSVSTDEKQEFEEII